ncbi:N-acetylmuramoyl-L-alanine amidase [Sinirhodobacter populi]|uniref:N-acetylmuramoyl-L-alanine amidase n=1 Tax=Paenirhodobacter populi TaxID=2306993 RepID=A0A443KMA4_9RHOB|nr:N-acetylmuramoyl-L-alanine amidase [Sinirhodobacter populi]RWR33739.1 N-acetylmuramoyl-L-alanine amidase [Sinirhodobacter populi]
MGTGFGARAGAAVVAVLFWLGLAVAGLAQQQLSGLARLDPARSTLLDDARGAEIVLGISQPVPFRAYLLDDPPRLVADFREVDFGRARPDAPAEGGLIRDIRWGGFRPGWSRLVAELTGPVRLDAAVEETGETPRIVLRLSPAQPEDFNARVGAPASALWDLPQPVDGGPPHLRQDGSAPLRVVLDPGHGGIDPGAEFGALDEAVLTLTFARELKEMMTRAGMQVTLTRDEDVFVSLEARVTKARALGADLFLSLHADALPEGQATGATIYLLNDTSGDRASQRLAERHDRADLLAGVDLTGQDDSIASILMDMARSETQPRSERLGRALAASIKGAGLGMHRHAIQHADFAVLKSPDIPSALLELGFLSSPRDRENLLDPEWRTQMARAILTGVEVWASADAAEARLLRQ